MLTNVLFNYQNVIPLVYDNSLSTIEILGKLTAAVNSIIDELNTVAISNQGGVNVIESNLKNLDVLSANPTGADLYEGRIWLIKYIESLLYDGLDAAVLTTGAAGNENAQAPNGIATFKTSLNYKPLVNITLKRIEIKFKTGTIVYHQTASNIRVRVCEDNGSGIPNENAVIGVGTITNTPSGNEITFIGQCIFPIPLQLNAGMIYHFVLDILDTTENAFYYTFINEYGSETDPLSVNTFYSNTWSPVYNAYSPGFKLWKV